MINPVTAPPSDAAAERLTIELARRRPRLEITELLLKVDAWTQFSSQLTHAAGATPRMSTLAEHLHAALLAAATNLGPTRMAASSDLSYRQVAWATEWYLGDEQLQAANAILVDYLHRLELAAHWGTGRFSSSDGMRSPARARAVDELHLLALLTRVRQERVDARLITPPRLHDVRAYKCVLAEIAYLCRLRKRATGGTIVTAMTQLVAGLARLHPAWTIDGDKFADRDRHHRSVRRRLRDLQAMGLLEWTAWTSTGRRRAPSIGCCAHHRQRPGARRRGRAAAALARATATR